MNKFTIPLLATAALVISACSETETAAPVEDTTTADTMTNDAAGTIVDVAVGNENFSTLVSAVTAADLGETLSGEGPFTVFAPTNDAFAKIDEATLTGLMTPESKDALTGILTYHVVSGKVDAATLTKAITDAGEGGYTITTVNGATLTAMLDGDAVKLTDAAGNVSTVTMTDVDASNGIIHAIDTVLMPS